MREDGEWSNKKVLDRYKNKDPDSEIKIEINDKLICYLIYT